MTQQKTASNELVGLVQKWAESNRHLTPSDVVGHLLFVAKMVGPNMRAEELNEMLYSWHEGTKKVDKFDNDMKKVFDRGINEF